LKRDVVVVGGGHNGLACAALLAKAGRKPLVLERRPVVGGAAVTEEFHPGFKAPSLAHVAGPLRPSLVEALGLQVETLSPEPRFVAPLGDGRVLRLWGDVERTAAEIRAFSGRDADRWPAFHLALSRISAALARVLDATPPDVDRPGLRDMWSLLGLGLAVRRLGREDAYRLLRFGPMAVADFAGEWFESEPLRALIAARGIHGSFAGPWSAGTTANLLLQAAAGGGAGAGSCVMVKGGPGALCEALAEAARRSGAEIRTGAEVQRLAVRDGRVCGVVLAGGEEIEAGAVVSGADPKRTFLRMLDPRHLDPVDLHRLRSYRQAGMCSKVNLALSALPSFKGVTDAATLAGRIHIGREVDEIERAFDAAKYGGIPARPWMDATIPTLTDPSLAPPERHVMSIYVQYTPYRLAQGDWDARRGELGDTVLRTLEDYAPGLSGLVLHRQVLTPLDLERTYGLTEGHPFHGEPSLNQLFTMRPLLGLGRYRGPLPGLYLCGAGAHPGGGLTGAPGANAAREVLRDLR
jgi:phytoene dehydrogenase-like protein